MTIIKAPECAITGYPSISGFDLNDNGDVVGRYAQCDIGDEAFIWTKDGGLVTLPRPGNVDSMAANGINNHREVCGTWTTTTAGQRGFVWSNGAYVELQPLLGPDSVGWSNANAISDDGTVVGSRSVLDNPNPMRAFKWKDGVFTDLPEKFPLSSSATDVRDHGVVCGTLGDPASPRAHRWTGKSIEVLPLAPGATGAHALALSGRGDVAGLMTYPNHIQMDQRPVVWKNDSPVELQILAPFTRASARAINDARQTVGTCRTPGVTATAGVLWLSWQAIDLDELVNRDLGIDVRSAVALNNFGHILANGRDEKNDAAVFLLTPVWQAAEDVDHNCFVGIGDLLMVIGDWGATISSSDVDGSGIVDLPDLIKVIHAWGSGG